VGFPGFSEEKSWFISETSVVTPSANHSLR